MSFDLPFFCQVHGILKGSKLVNIGYDFQPFIINNINVIIREIGNKVLCEALCCDITWVSNGDNNRYPPPKNPPL